LSIFQPGTINIGWKRKKKTRVKFPFIEIGVRVSTNCLESHDGFFGCIRVHGLEVEANKKPEYYRKGGKKTSLRGQKEHSSRMGRKNGGRHRRRWSDWLEAFLEEVDR